MSTSSQNPEAVSATRAFADLAAAIDRRVSTDKAAELLAAFRAAIRTEALSEAADAMDAQRNEDGANLLRSMASGGTR